MKLKSNKKFTSDSSNGFNKKLQIPMIFKIIIKYY
jgi:hypothetical protein